MNPIVLSFTEGRMVQTINCMNIFRAKSGNL
jgi:hypothetical protein